MKKIIVVVLWLVLPVVQALAQNDSLQNAPADTVKSPWLSGGWLQVSYGVFVNNSHSLYRQFNLPRVFGQHEFPVKNINWGTAIGAEFTDMIGRNFMVGVSMSVAEITRQVYSPGEISLNAYSGYLKLAKVLLLKNDLILNPYAGLGYATSRMRVTNLMTKEDVVFNPREILGPGGSQNYIANYVLGEIGAGIRKTLRLNLVAGVDAGIYYSPSKGKNWRKDGEKVSTRTIPGMNGAYLRVSLGFGSVYYPDK